MGPRAHSFPSAAAAALDISKDSATGSLLLTSASISARDADRCAGADLAEELHELVAASLLPMTSERPSEPGHRQLLDGGPALGVLGVLGGRLGIALFIAALLIPICVEVDDAPPIATGA